MPWNPLERSALVDALTEAGPGEPTLCAGWRSEHLAAHVVLRESSLVAAGAALPALAERAEAAIQDLGNRSASPRNFAALVERLAGGPPPHHPMRLAGDTVQLLELFVHTEDVRRGALGDRTPPRPRSAEHADALWHHLRRMSRLALRRSPVGVVLAVPQGEVRAAPPRPGGDVVVRGTLDDVVLHVFGRRTAARVEVEGEPDAVAAYTRRDG